MFCVGSSEKVLEPTGQLLFSLDNDMASSMLSLFKTREAGMVCVILACMTLSEVDRLALKFKVANLSGDLADQKDAYEAILKDQKAQLAGPTTKR